MKKKITILVLLMLSRTDSFRPRKYWNDLKLKLEKEGSQVSEKIGYLKLVIKYVDNKKIKNKINYFQR